MPPLKASKIYRPLISTFNQSTGYFFAIKGGFENQRTDSTNWGSIWKILYHQIMKLKKNLWKHVYKGLIAAKPVQDTCYPTLFYPPMKLDFKRKRFGLIRIIILWH